MLLSAFAFLETWQCIQKGSFSSTHGPYLASVPIGQCASKCVSKIRSCLKLPGKFAQVHSSFYEHMITSPKTHPGEHSSFKLLLRVFWTSRYGKTCIPYSPQLNIHKGMSTALKKLTVKRSSGYLLSGLSSTLHPTLVTAFRFSLRTCSYLPSTLALQNMCSTAC